MELKRNESQFELARDPAILFDPNQSVLLGTFVAALVVLAFKVVANTRPPIGVPVGVIVMFFLPFLFGRIECRFKTEGWLKKFVNRNDGTPCGELIARPLQLRRIAEIENRLPDKSTSFSTGLRRGYREIATIVCLFSLTVIRLLPGVTIEAVFLIIVFVTLHCILYSMLYRSKFEFRDGELIIRMGNPYSTAQVLVVPIASSTVNVNLESGSIFLKSADTQVWIEIGDLNRPIRFLARLLKELQSEEKVSG